MSSGLHRLFSVKYEMILPHNIDLVKWACLIVTTVRMQSLFPIGLYLQSHYAPFRWSNTWTNPLFQQTNKKWRKNCQKLGKSTRLRSLPWHPILWNQTLWWTKLETSSSTLPGIEEAVIECKEKTKYISELEEKNKLKWSILEIKPLL